MDKSKYTLHKSYKLGSISILVGIGSAHKCSKEKAHLYVSKRLSNFSEFFLKNKFTQDAISWKLKKSEAAEFYSR